MPPDAKSPTLSPQTQFKITLSMLVTVAVALIGLGVTYASLPKRDELQRLGNDLAGARAELLQLKVTLEERDKQHREALQLMREELRAMRDAQNQTNKRRKPLP